jgi:predicted lysophospholipase L1 biosynthesis ABC-type transport system permease subunit
MLLTFGAVFICSIFFNYSFDLKAIGHLIDTPQAQAVYDAQIMQSNVTMASAGGMLGAVTMLVLLFSIGHFIQESGAELGVLKALGYSDSRLSLSFAKFGLSILIASALAYGAAAIFAQSFYNAMDGEGILPELVKFRFRWQTPLAFVVAPAILFSAVSVLYAKLSLRKKPLDLIHGARKTKISKLTAKLQNRASDNNFLRGLRRNMLFSNLVLIFFIGFAAFGFAAQNQMAFMMYEATGGNLFMPTVFIGFGLMLGFVTLLLALTFITKKNSKYLAMLKAYGYTDRECGRAMFGGYRVVTYIGFAIGTVYQYFFMKFMIGIFASAYDDVPEVKFSVLGFFVVLGAFLIVYELIMLFYKKKIAKIPLREIMQA